MAKTKNEFFKNGETPFTDIAHMLSDLDDKGVIPDAMREAIRQHASNSLDTLPLNIAAIAHNLASAFDSDPSKQSQQVVSTAYAIAALAEQVHGWYELGFCFGPENTLRKSEVEHG